MEFQTLATKVAYAIAMAAAATTIAAAHVAVLVRLTSTTHISRNGTTTIKVQTSMAAALN
ncbi:hypothetical protein M8C21_031127 [Ambrosia artemisiifolia]|uniref:Uncharacterized protein n=1 Tax=Ambrosia artemisiifolia TaxID=4212 RepID=A0AAD5D3B0_AMBAR|nr:hypothetical protein M8C21_031127 [Ambrosia artemisiifolia]